MNMRGSLSVDQIVRAGLIAAVVFVAGVTQSIPQAQDVFADIQKHQERYDKLERDIATSQGRILSSVGAFAAQELAYGQLDFVASALASINREFSVLSTSIALANLVTDRRAIPHAWRYVELQRDYMVKRASSSAESIEKRMHRVGDPETSRLLLEARDLFRASLEFLGRMRVKE